MVETKALHAARPKQLHLWAPLAAESIPGAGTLTSSLPFRDLSLSETLAVFPAEDAREKLR